MDLIQKDPVLQFNPDTLVTIRKQYNLANKEEINAAIDLLDDWIKKQNHFTRKDFPRDYLERTIILLKGSVEKAKSQMDKLCTLRSLNPTFFEGYNQAKTIYADLKDIFPHALLPKLTPDHQRIYIMKCMDNKITSKLLFNLYLTSVMTAEYIKSHDYCDGLVAIIDFRDVSILDFVKEMNLVECRQMITIAMEGYGFRIKGMHLITTSSAIDTLVKIMKQMLSGKIGSRIYVHKDVESIHSVIPKEILPSEYGGNEKSLKTLSDEWAEAMSSEKALQSFKEMSEARTDESLRQTDKFNEQYMGVAGTFRTLTVD